MKVELFIKASDNGKFLHGAGSLGEILYNTLTNACEKSPDDTQYRYLLDLLGKEEVSDFDVWFYERISKELSMLNNFAKELKLYDILSPACLMSKTKLGKVIINLLEVAELKIVLVARSWYSPDHLFLDFELCSWDYQFEVQQSVTGIK